MIKHPELRWGVLGNATIANKCVMPAIAASANGRIRALATGRPEEAGKEVAKNGIEKLYSHYEEVIGDSEVDAVYLPLPNNLHLPWAIKALEHGKHVLCEKPLACNSNEARKMIEAAGKHDRLLMEALMYRFHPRSQKVKEMVQEGCIGTPRLVRAAFCFAMDNGLLERGDNYRLNVTQGGGALLDVGSYGTSVARWLLGEEPVSVQGQAVYHERFGVDIHAVASMRFASGALATVEASFCSGLQQTFTVVGSDGALELPHNAFIPWEHDAHFTWRKKDEEEGESIVVPGVDEYRLMVEHFNHAVLTGARPAVSLDDSLANLRVLDGLAQAMRSDRSISLPG
ncbi:MAG: Gfo/Idh/MocA family oxidoreductase [Desulfocapsaceae bacterium]|nr:Gfo/Idh/MocA family oxidoreductase [Desulfocapsaceae bacterium]